MLVLGGALVLVASGVHFPFHFIQPAFPSHVGEERQTRSADRALQVTAPSSLRDPSLFDQSVATELFCVHRVQSTLISRLRSRVGRDFAVHRSCSITSS